MPENNAGTGPTRRKVRHRGRIEQVPIYLGKQLRFFVNESDWKVIPMAAIIAALVAMVIRTGFFINMEGALIGSFALTCVALWNGCFNSIQAVCRERPIIKREHRSGMHITSYMAAHMIYQFMLCLIQTVVSLYVMRLMGVKIPDKGFITRWMMLDLCITMMMISYASDMMSLFVSSISHTTTAAMTVMPFVLIFQLVFSGGVIPLPEWAGSLSNFTISNYGIRAIAAQGGYNELPMATPWETLNSMRDTEIGGTYTYGQVMDAMNSKGLKKYYDTEILPSLSVGDALDFADSTGDYFHVREEKLLVPFSAREALTFILEDESMQGIRDAEISPGIGTIGPVTAGTLIRSLTESHKADELLDRKMGVTVTAGQVLDLLKTDRISGEKRQEKLTDPVTLGKAVDFINRNKALQNRREQTFTFRTTMGELIDLAGEDRVRETVQTQAAKAARKPEYDRTVENIAENWLVLGLFIALFALMATVSLELIDRDRR